MPANLTQAELMQLRENLSGELMTIQKFANYAQTATDPQAKQLITNIQKSHERHRDILAKHLNITAGSAQAGAGKLM